MKIKEITNEGLKRAYELSLSSKEFDLKINAKLDEISRTVKLPGFRPGKVPVSMVKQKFGDQIKSELIKETLDNAVKKTIEKENLRLSNQPQLDDVSFDDGKDLKAKLVCEIMPVITLPDLTKITLEKPILPIDKKELDKSLQNLANEHKPTSKVGKGKKSKLGDVVIIDFVGKIDGIAFEGGDGKDHRLVLGSKSFIPGFEEGLIGYKNGDKVDVKLNFPKDYQAKHLAGKEAVFECLIKELLETGKPEINDELAKKFGFEKLENLKEAVSNQMSSQNDQLIRQFIKKGLLDKLSNYTEFEIPAGLYDSEYLAVIKSMRTKDDNKTKDNNENLDDKANSNEDNSEIKKIEKEIGLKNKTEAKKIALRRVRLGLLLTEFGRINDIKVSEEDTKQAVIEESKKYPGQEKQVIEFYQKNPDSLQHLSGPIFEEKVVDFILGKVSFKEKQTTIEKLNQSLNEQTESQKSTSSNKKQTKKKQKVSSKK